VEGRPLKTSFAGIIMKENVRNFDLENLDLLDCFKPNDIVKAMVISEQGSGKEQSTSLSTV
jgi:exosome complex RNA-binding protein Csl4